MALVGEARVIVELSKTEIERYLKSVIGLFRRFWKLYLAISGDMEMLEVVAPFFAFRELVMAHPIWDPNLAGNVRQKIASISTDRSLSLAAF